MYFFDLVDYYSSKIIGNQYEKIPICDIKWCDMATTARATRDAYLKALSMWYSASCTCLEDGDCKDAILAKWAVVQNDITLYNNALVAFWNMMCNDDNFEDCTGEYNPTLYQNYINAQQTLQCDIEELTYLVDGEVNPPECFPVNNCLLDGFCDVNTLNIVYPMTGIDFLDDKRIQPTCEELEIYDFDLQYEKEDTWRSINNQYIQLYNANMLAKVYGAPDCDLYNLSFHQKYLTNPNNATTLFKNGFRDVNMKYGRNNSEYSVWFDVVCGGQSLNDIFPNIEQFVFLPMVDDISQAPTGVVGDVIHTRVLPGDDYYWSPITNNWELLGTPDCIGEKIADMFTIKRDSRDAVLKEKNELVLSLRPYLFSGYYLPAWQIKKYKNY